MHDLRLKRRDLSDVILIVGGIIPEADIPALRKMGVAKVFTPGAALTEITEFLSGAVVR